MKRIEWVDWGKSLAIFSVVLLHTHCVPAVSVYINAYVMPLFFFLSGFLFSFERNPEYVPFVKKRFRQIVMPYLWINIITYLAWVLLLRHFGTSEDDGIVWYRPLAAIFAGLPSLLIHNVPTWSLLAFFVTEVMFYPLAKSTGGKGAWAGAIALAVACVLYYTVPEEMMNLLPFAIGPAIMGLAFYALGYFCRQIRLIGRKNRIWFDLALFIASGLGFYYVATLNGHTMFYIYDFGNFWLFCIGGILGICIFVCASRLMSKAGNPRIVRFVSYGTLLICGFHLLMFSLMKGVAWFGFGIEPDALTAGFGRGLLFSISAMLLCLPIVYFVKRYARFLIDK